jgi:phenylalanyl-tRNA synthetase beta chain
MQFSESWLRTFCNPSLSTVALSDVLTMAGLEVEDLKPVAPPFTNVVVGEIVEAVQHPNADRLRVCKVDVGQSELLDIVCGAPNARVGIRVPCAMVGAELPPGDDGKPFMIKVGKLRGVESEGMLCSARELHLADDHGGLLELPLDAPLGQNIRAYLDLDDTLFTLKLTPNLAHVLSVYGVARELSALTGATLLSVQYPAVLVTNRDMLGVKVSASDLCGRFSGRVIRNVNTEAKTPQWMVDRLARSGQRSVSALVDISNYVMFELGRPSHIFDLDKISGGLDIRWGTPGEQIKLLNGTTVSVDEQVGVIADDMQVESLAGIMGGDATAVSDDTKNIYLEAAFWWPKSIAGRSRRFNFSTDAGHRFERGVDPSLTVEHIEHITQLILDICGTPSTTCGPVDDHVVNMPVAVPVLLRVARASKIIGMPLTQSQCVHALERLGLPVEQAPGVLTVFPPTYRFDIQIEEDLIEEVIRMVGYDQLPHTPPLGPITAKIRSERLRGPFDLRRALASLGYQETINFSFVEERWEHELAGNSAPIKLLNPIASQMNVMRSSLLGSLLQVLKFNQARKASRVRVFEIGSVFLRDSAIENTDLTVQGVDQPMRIAGLASGSVNMLQWGLKDRAVDFFDVKGEIETLLGRSSAQFVASTHPSMHPGRCAKVVLDGRTIGYLGELHPKWRQVYEISHAPILFELELDAVLARQVPVFVPVTKFQSVQRDIAVVVGDSVSHTALMASIWAAPTLGLLRDASLFDVYRSKPTADTPVAEGSTDRSLAVRLTLSSEGGTLTEQQIESAISGILAKLSSDVGARQRV